MRRFTKLIGVLGAGALAISALAGPATASTTDQGRVLPWFPNRNGPTVVARGLNNPRQLSLTAGDGVLLIAEAGKGGPNCTGEGEDTTCLGATGAVSTVLVPQFGQNRKAFKLVSGLLSGAGPDGSFAVGADGVSARSLGAIQSIVTYAPPEFFPSGIPGDQAGKLLSTHPFGTPQPVADISGFELANDPDGQGVDSNPYAVLALRDRTLVADAAANTILSVDPNGVVSLFSLLPNSTDGECAGRPNDNGTTGCDAVPTSLAEGPDGGIYVGTLAGEGGGGAHVYKLDPTSGAIVDTWGGLTTVTGVAVGRDGSVYASELFAGDPSAPAPGDLVKIAADGTRSTKTVPFPAGVAVDKYNNVYVSAFSTAPDTGLGVPDTDSSGQIWRLRF